MHIRFACTYISECFLGYVPHDGVPKMEPSTVILPVTVIVISLNGGGVAFALFCLLFNLIYRKKK